MYLFKLVVPPELVLVVFPLCLRHITFATQATAALRTVPGYSVMGSRLTAAHLTSVVCDCLMRISNNIRHDMEGSGLY